MHVNQFVSKLFRRKVLGGESNRGGLVRRLNGWDLTALGVGSTLGAGIYVITGAVAHDKSGPSIVLSFAIAGFASILAGLSYAEFGSRVPRAGSAYVYSFVAVGELIAWVTGWNLILEYIIGASSVARGWASYMDSLTNQAITEHLNNHMPVIASGHSNLLALVVTLVLTLMVGVGVKESTTVNNILTTINMCVVVFVIIAGLFYVSAGNWDPFIPEKFGFNGVFKGAATCFYAYIGFDVIATSAEETKRPERNVPFGIVTALIACALSYMGVSAIVTMMVPYDQIDVKAPLSAAFAFHGADWAKIIIAIGALCGLSTSLMASIFPLPRIIYAIANDGLLWPWLGKVHHRFNTPLNATLISGLLAGLMAFILDIDELANMMSIGTLISYTMVSACVVILRYEVPRDVLPGSLGPLKHSSGAFTGDMGTPYAAGVLVETPVLMAMRNARTTSSLGEADFDSINKSSTSVAPRKGSAPSSFRSRLKCEERAKLLHSTPKTSYTASVASPIVSDRVSPNAGTGGPDELALPAQHDTFGDETSASSASSASVASFRNTDTKNPMNASNKELKEALLSPSQLTRVGWARSYFNLYIGRRREADPFRAIVVVILAFVLACMIASVLENYSDALAIDGSKLGVHIAAGFFAALAILHAVLAMLLPPIPQPQLSFKCPFVPLLPMTSMAINSYLLMSLDSATWIRFAVWTALGLAIYFLYGMKNSRTQAQESERQRANSEDST